MLLTVKLFDLRSSVYSGLQDLAAFVAILSCQTQESVNPGLETVGGDLVMSVRPPWPLRCLCAASALRLLWGSLCCAAFLGIQLFLFSVVVA